MAITITRISREAILKLLTEKENFLQVALAEQEEQRKRGGPNSYKMLLEHIFLAEFQENLRKIKTLFTELPEQDWQTQLNEKFSTLATLRYNEIKNTCLSYTEKPNSLTNDLYNELFTLLYPQGSFYQRLQCLCPTIKNRLVPKILKNDNAEKVSAENTEIILTREMLSEKALEKYSFSNIVLDEQQELLVGVDELIHWRKSFSTFQKMLGNLELSYPVLYEKLKHHNPEILALIRKVESFHQALRTLTPQKALEQLNRCLQVGGSQIAGDVYRAVADFQIYLEGFPEERQRKILKALQGRPDSKHALQDKAKLLQNIFGAARPVSILFSHINTCLHDCENALWLNESPSLAMSEAEKAARIRQIEEKDISFLREPIGFLSLKNLPQAYLAAIHQLRFDSFDARVELFRALPAEYYASLGDFSFTRVDGAYDLGSLMVWLSPEQCRQLLMFARSKGKINQWIKNVRDFIELREFLSQEQRSILCKTCQSELTTWLKSAKDFRDALRWTIFEERSVIYEACQSKLTTWIENALDFNYVLENLSPEQRSVVYEACQSKLRTLIKCAYHFRAVLQYLTPEQRSAVYEACQSELTRWIYSSYELGLVIQYLSPEQQRSVAARKASQREPTSWIKGAGDFGFLLKYLSPEQRSVVYEACQSNLTTWIKDVVTFTSVLKYLSPEQCKAVCKACQSEFTSRIKDAHDFGLLLKDLSPEQRSVVYEAYQRELTSWIYSSYEFGLVIEYLSLEQSVDLCLLLLQEMPSLLPTWGSIDAILINSMPSEPEKARVLAQGICSALKSGERKNGHELLLLCQLSLSDESFFSAQEKEVLQNMANQYISHFFGATSHASSSTTRFFNSYSSAALRMDELIQKLSGLANSNNAEALRVTFAENELLKLNPHHKAPAP